MMSQTCDPDKHAEKTSNNFFKSNLSTMSYVKPNLVFHAKKQKFLTSGTF